MAEGAPKMAEFSDKGGKPGSYKNEGYEKVGEHSMTSMASSLKSSKLSDNDDSYENPCTSKKVGLSKNPSKYSASMANSLKLNGISDKGASFKEVSTENPSEESSSMVSQEMAKLSDRVASYKPLVSQEMAKLSDRVASYKPFSKEGLSNEHCKVSASMAKHSHKDDSYKKKKKATERFVVLDKGKNLVIHSQEDENDLNQSTIKEQFWKEMNGFHRCAREDADVVDQDASDNDMVDQYVSDNDNLNKKEEEEGVYRYWDEAELYEESYYMCHGCGEPYLDAQRLKKHLKWNPGHRMNGGRGKSGREKGRKF